MNENEEREGIIYKRISDEYTRGMKRMNKYKQNPKDEYKIRLRRVKCIRLIE